MTNERRIIREAIAKANTMFSPSYNQHTEALSGIPSDRDEYDYAGGGPSYVGIDPEHYQFNESI